MLILTNCHAQQLPLNVELPQIDLSFLEALATNQRMTLGTVANAPDRLKAVDQVAVRIRQTVDRISNRGHPNRGQARSGHHHAGPGRNQAGGDG